MAVLVIATMFTGAGGLLLTTARDNGHLTPPLAETTDDRFMDFFDGTAAPTCHRRNR